MACVLEVSRARAQTFINAGIAAEVLGVNAKGEFSLVESTDDLRNAWERRFDEIFWPSVTTPWKKLGRAAAKKVWMTRTFALIKPKTEEAADALCVSGWLSGERWSDEIDDGFIEQRSEAAQQPATLSPLDRARRQQAEQQVFDMTAADITAPAEQPLISERLNELSLPEFTVTL